MATKYPTKSSIEKVYKVFRRNYKPVPLEAFGDNPYKTLVSTLLSSRTRDETTLKVCIKLFKKAPNIKSLEKLSPNQISKLIYPVGFYKTKSKHLNTLAKILLNKCDGVIPKTREGLVSLPGVGRKTANLVLNRAFNIPAIAVDTHVHRIMNTLGWINTKTPIETEIRLNSILPKEYWSETNRLFVSIGQQYRSKKKLTSFLTKWSLVRPD